MSGQTHRLGRDRRAVGVVASPVSPLTIFPTGNLLWLDGYGGTYLRDSGGNVPSDAEAIASYIDRGNIGNGTGAAGTTFSAAAFSGRGGIAFDGASGSVLVSPSWLADQRMSGGAVWQFNGDNQTLYQHQGLNGHTNVYRGTAVTMRRMSGAAGDLTFATTAGIPRADVWRMSTTRIDGTDSEAGTGAVVSASAITSAGGTTTIGGLTSTIFRLTGLVGELVLHDSYASATQIADLLAYLRARWGV